MSAVDDRDGPEYEALQAEFGLNFEQMKDVVNYLQEWRDNTLFALNKDQEMIVIAYLGLLILLKHLMILNYIFQSQVESSHAPVFY